MTADARLRLLRPEPELAAVSCRGSSDRAVTVMGDMDLSTKEMAARLGVAPAEIRRRIDTGELEAHMVGGAWRIPIEQPNVEQSALPPPVSLTASIQHQVQHAADEFGGLIPIAVSAEIMGVGTKAVRAAVQRGELGGRKLGGRWYIPAAVLAEYLGVAA